MDGEVGRFVFTTHAVDGVGAEMYNTATALFPDLHGQEWYRTRGFKEIAILQGTVEQSYRKTNELINRIRHQAGATSARTLRESTEMEGARIAEAIAAKANRILKRKGFTEAGEPKEATAQFGPQAPGRLAADTAAEAIAQCGAPAEWQAEIAANPVAYEEPSQTVAVSIDDVGVKKQKQQRDGAAEPPEAEAVDEPAATACRYVHNTIAHVQKGTSSYTLNGPSTVAVLRLLIAFLLGNDLLLYGLIFFVDGQRTLHAAIVKTFAWFRSIQMILDWYHLEKKCQQQLSLAMKGRRVRNEILATRMKLLWYGLVDRAIAYLKTVDVEQIKNEVAFQGMIQYLQRHKGGIPAYAVRHALGLRNSSNIGEKHNDLIVSERQKHNGMSWSKKGSVSLASVTAVLRNREEQNWLKRGQIAFKLTA